MCEGSVPEAVSQAPAIPHTHSPQQITLAFERKVDPPGKVVGEIRREKGHCYFFIFPTEKDIWILSLKHMICM